MRKYLLFLSLSISFLLAKAQYGNQERIGNVDFTYLLDKVNIQYDFINCSSSDQYMVVAEAYYENGNKIDAKSWIGDVGTVSAGTSKRIIWDIKKDGLQIEQGIFFRIVASKVPNTNLKNAMLYSSIWPGAGYKQVGAKQNAPWLGALGYAAIVTSVSLNMQAANSMSQYRTELDQSKSDALYKDAQSKSSKSMLAAGVAIGIWAVNYAIVASKYSKVKNITHEQIMQMPESERLQAESPKKKISTRGLPPNLYAELSFSDDNGNGILEAKETGELTVKIMNQGKGDALKLDVLLKDSVNDPNLQVDDSRTINVLKAGMSTVVKFPMKTTLDLRTNKHRFEIIVKESYGFDMEPAYLRLPTYAYQSPKFVVSGYEIIDMGEGTAAIQEDGQLQLGEQVKVKVTIQNIGQSTAKDVKYAFATIDNNVYLENASGKLGDLQAGGVKVLVFTMTPNKRVVPIDNKIPLDFSITEAIGRATYRKPLQIALNQKPQKPNIVNVKADVNSLNKEIAVFEIKSKKFTTNIGGLTDIKTIKPSATKRPKALGIVLGISKYENMAPAPYADNDALLMKDYFTKVLGISNVITLTNQDVTISKLKKIFATSSYGDLKKNIEMDSTEVYVFYSGHGVPDKGGDNTYLFPYDGDKDGLEDFAYNTETLYNNLNQLGAKHITLFMDACFSGFSKQSDKIKSENLIAQKGVIIKPKKLWLNNPKFTVFTSSTGSETSLGFDPTETGLFTYYLCAGLQGKADANGDRKITSGELRDYIQRNVKTTSQQISGLQSPEFTGDENRVLVEY